jgi:hypothetical protein
MQSILDESLEKQELTKEVNRWVNRFEPLRNNPRAYIVSLNLLRELIRWQDKNPEIRREIAKEVVRVLSGQFDLYDQLKTILYERSES